MDLCLIRHYIHFYVTYLHALMQVDHHLLSYLFVFFYFCSITLFCSTSSNSFIFSSYLMFYLGSTPTLYYCLLDMSFIYYHFFVWEPLGPWLMRFFSTHCISCMRGMGIISLGSLSLISFRFFHPITLAYITSHVLRPSWNHDFTHCIWQLTHEQYLKLVGDYFLKHDGWSRGDGLHWGIPILPMMDFWRWCIIKLWQIFFFIYSYFI